MNEVYRFSIRVAVFSLLTFATPPIVAKGLTVPKISGLLNGRYSYSDREKETHGLDIRRVRLGAEGELGDKVDYKFQAEYETSVKVIDAYLRWKIVPEFNIQIGEYKVPYSQETLYGPTSWLTIENPAAVANLNGYNDLSGMKSNGRDVGITVYGDLWRKLFSYRIGVFNGNGINVKDDNNKKDFAGLLWFRPVTGLSLSAGLYAGTYGPRGDEHVRNRFSAGVEWKSEKLMARAEYLSGNTGGQKSDGAYGEVGYWVIDIVQPVLSVDYFKADRDDAESQWNYQVGVNIVPIKNLRIQVAYTYMDNRTVDDVNQFETQFILHF